jgi:hypothetical protein
MHVSVKCQSYDISSMILVSSAKADTLNIQVHVLLVFCHDTYQKDSHSNCSENVELDKSHRLPQWYLHLIKDIFNQTIQFACTGGRKNYVNGSLVAGMVTHVNKMWARCRTKRGNQAFRLEVGHGADILNCKNLTVLKPWQQRGHGPRMGQSAVGE